MRDRRFIAAHRGGPLDHDSHVVLARWAADCAERVLSLFTRGSDDRRPQDAIDTIRKWANGEVKTGAAMKASLASHAAAREAKDKAAIAAARAAGHAVATAHAADHSMGALLYALKALEAAGRPSDTELRHRLAKLPEHLRECVTLGMSLRLKKLGAGEQLKQNTHTKVSKLMPKRNIATGVVHDVPADLEAILLADREALALWEDITPLARNEWICWVEDAKQEQTRLKRLGRVQTDLKAGKRRPCCWPGCPHRGNKRKTFLASASRKSIRRDA